MVLSKRLFEIILPSVLETRFPEIEELSVEQSRALFALLNRQDVFAILPTGHGKSIIFQLLTDFCKNLRGYNYPQNAIVLVVCPLKSLVDSHIRELHCRGITATSLTGDDIDESGILQGQYSYVFASPESLLENDKWRKMLQSDVYRSNLFAVVTDEAHVVPKWGFIKHKHTKENKKEYIAAFRECFSRLGELRSLVSHKQVVPVLALTATANVKTRNDIKKSLCLRENCVEIYKSPNRENIYLNIVNVNTNVSTSFSWLIKQIREKDVTLDKTIVYCKSIKDCGRLFMYFKEELGVDAYAPNCEMLSENLLFAMYHHSTLTRIQERTLDSFHDKNGKCRLIFATNALGMGVNFQDIRFIVHYGPPREMEEVVQQIGRAGRDGKPAHALIMYNGRHLKNCDQSVKDMCKATSGCLRKRMLADFGVEDLQSQEKHNCCINCHKECLCSDDKCPIPFPEISRTKTTIKENLNTRKITLEQKQLLEELLRDNISVMSSGLLNFLGVDGTALFSESLIKKVLKHAKFVFTKDYILENLPVFKSEHAMDILCMFNDVFEDVDEGELDANQCSSFDEDYIYNVEMYICDEFLEESSDSDCTISDTDDELV